MRALSSALLTVAGRGGERMQRVQTTILRRHNDSEVRATSPLSLLRKPPIR